MKLRIEVKNLDDLNALAMLLAQRMRGGEVIELIGDVGAGKTTFTAALVKALESEDHVSSPTFTVGHVYEGGRFPVYHFDFYRLGDNDALIKHELTEVDTDSGAIVIMEWAQSMKSVLEDQPLSISIRSTGETERIIEIAVPEPYHYLGAEAS